MNSIRRLAVAVAVLCALSVALPAISRELSLEERIAAQRKIEQVYWNHRIWPQVNPGPKPPLSAVVPDETIALKVDDALRGAQALEQIWGRSLGRDEIQAELDRMVRESAAPQMLREIFQALGDDPYVIAECLVRTSLVERRLQDLYAWDDKLHAPLRAHVDAARAAAGGFADLDRAGAQVFEAVTTLEGSGPREDGPALVLEADDWRGFIRQLASAAGGPPTAGMASATAASIDETGAAIEALPVGALGRVVEDADGFRIVTVVEKSAVRIRTATAYWPKVSFNDWWKDARTSYPASVDAAAAGDYRLEQPEGNGCIDDSWKAIPGPDVPDPRAEHTAVWTGSEMLVFGGISWLPYGDGGRYNPATDTWTILPGTSIPAPRYEHSAVWTGTKMIVWGGLGLNGAAINTGSRLDPVTNTWQQTTLTGAPTSRNYHTAVWTGTEMIIWGGEDVNVVSQNTGARYNPTTDVWTATSTGTNVPTARYQHTAVWTGSQMIVWGGNAGLPTNTGGRYTPSTNSWLPTSTGTNVPPSRYQHTAVWTGTEMIVWGGNTFIGTGGRYNPSTDTWLTVTTTGAPAGRGSHTAVWTGTQMIVWGGYGPAVNTGGRYTPSTDSWLPTSTGAGVPSARYWHTAVWTGTQMIVWGGKTPNTFFRTGGRYDPVADAWSPTSSGGDAPSPRYNVKAVWTGAEMIVWGGTNAGTRIGTGGRYDPATSTWLPTYYSSSSPSSPSPREQHAMVWDGTEMLMWGGWYSTVYLNAGGRYNPASDTWTATSTTNVPAARGEHSAVWTGTEMIVWGGFTGALQNTGARYNPATDAWTATSTGTNVPAARQYHAAVWTGSKMIVWGGAIFGGVGNTGGVYDPATDAWTPTTLTAAPVARQLFGGVWTGNRMLVWGGRDSVNATLASGGSYDPAVDAWTAIASAPSGQLQFSTVWTGTHMIPWGGQTGLLNTGWLYEPGANSWTPTSTAPPVPAGRVGHAAVWTGSEMIVWGGLKAANAYASDGGRYCPITCPTWFRDADGDGHGTAADSRVACTQPAGYVSPGDDCNDADVTVWQRAPELDGLTIAPDKMTVSWNLGIATGYDLMRGNLAELPVGSGPSETCLASAIGGTSVVDPTVPAPDQGFWYLARGRNSCGGGPYGYRTGGIEDVSFACP